MSYHSTSETSIPEPRKLSRSGSIDLPPPSPHPGLTSQKGDWRRVQVGTLIEDQRLIELDADMNIHSACRLLVDSKVSSVPVFDQETHSYVGMFDYADLLTYLLIILQRSKILSPEDVSGLEDDEQLARLVSEAAERQPMPVRCVSDISRNNPFYSCIPETSVIQAIEILSKGVHRLAIMDGGVRAKGILSQLTIVRYLTEHIFSFASLSEVLSQTLEELDLGIRKVVTISIDSPVLEALTTMSVTKVFSLAVVGRDNQLLGNFSLSDVKHLMKNNRRLLLQTTLREFINHVKQEQGAETGQDTVLVFQVHRNHTIRLVMAKMAATNAHRMWITDGEGRACGVVSLTDIMRVLYKAGGANDD